MTKSARRDTKEGPLVVAFAGDACTGKTTMALTMKAFLRAGFVEAISLDGYHTEDRARRINTRRPALDPKANDLSYAAEHLAALRTGNTAEVPTYDHRTGKFGQTRVALPAPVIIWDGLHALYPIFRSLTDLRVFFEVEPELQRQWRLSRDIHERGYEPAVLEDLMNLREPAVTAWISPQRAAADILLHYSVEDGQVRVKAHVVRPAARCRACRLVSERVCDRAIQDDSALEDSKERQVLQVFLEALCKWNQPPKI
jgi:phosphoribulokinase